MLRSLRRRYVASHCSGWPLCTKSFEAGRNPVALLLEIGIGFLTRRRLARHRVAAKRVKAEARL